jgi:LexA DNA binding domain/KAP family P-loop domain
MVDSTPKPDDLTRRQRDILKAVRKLTTEHGHPPSLREVAEAVGINSTGSLHYQYRELQKKGYLRYLNNNPRSVQVRLPGELTFPADTKKPAPLNAINATRLIVPGITNDAVEGHPDKLGVDADARALAALVASRRLQPPLAIGLCGEWGSGKTFFMKRVESSIKELTASGDTDSFCSRVEPVWFSAWHYAEGNLWASLLQHIFRTLNGVKSGRQVTRDEVMGKVRSARQVTLAAAEKVEAARARREAVREAIVAAEEHHEKAIQEAGKLRIKDLWDAVKLSADDLDVKLVVQAAK